MDGVTDDALHFCVYIPWNTLYVFHAVKCKVKVQTNKLMRILIIYSKCIHVSCIPDF